MVNQKSGSTGSIKVKAGTGVDKNTKTMFEAGKLKIPTQKPAVDVNTKVDPKEQVLVGGMNLNGERKKKPKKLAKAGKDKKEKPEKIHWKTIGADENGKGGVEFRMIDEIIRPQTGMEETKQLHLQQMLFKSDGRHEYRLCYYQRKNKNDVFRFARFCAFVPSQDFTAILKEATTRGWF